MSKSDEIETSPHSQFSNISSEIPDAQSHIFVHHCTINASLYIYMSKYYFIIETSHFSMIASNVNYKTIMMMMFVLDHSTGCSAAHTGGMQRREQ